jgi:hypothetical protein
LKREMLEMKRSLLLLTLLSLIAGIHGVWAQVPNTMSYQGVLHDGSGGAVADSLYAITFNLYDVSTGGAPLWTEVQDVQVKGGIFSVILGNVTPFNLPFDIPYWLGVTVEGSPEFSPRRELTASPYSLNAKSIEAGAVTEDALADNAVSSGKIAGGTVVRSLNTLTDDVTLAPGVNVTITVSGDTLTIGTTGVGSGDVTSVTAGDGLTGGGLSGDLTLDGGAGGSRERYHGVCRQCCAGPGLYGCPVCGRRRDGCDYEWDDPGGCGDGNGPRR